MSIALGSKTETRKLNGRKLNIVMEVMKEVYIEFPETKEIMHEKLKQKHYKENIFIEEISLFFFDKTFVLCNVRVLKKELVLLLELHLTSHVKECNV